MFVHRQRLGFQKTGFARHRKPEITGFICQGFFLFICPRLSCWRPFLSLSTFEASHWTIVGVCACVCGCVSACVINMKERGFVTQRR